jgi:hypothetical protein
MVCTLWLDICSSLNDGVQAPFTQAALAANMHKAGYMFFQLPHVFVVAQQQELSEQDEAAHRNHSYQQALYSKAFITN